MSVDVHHIGYPHTVEEMTLAGCTSARGIRFWEEQGLLGHVHRTPGGTRRYSAHHMDRARIIAAASFGGWKLDEIKAMLAEYWTDKTVFEAIAIRLEDQIRAAVRLTQNLPASDPSDAPLEYDL